MIKPNQMAAEKIWGISRMARSFFFCRRKGLAAAGFGVGIVLMILYNRYVQQKRPVTFVITGYAEN